EVSTPSTASHPRNPWLGFDNDRDSCDSSSKASRGSWSPGSCGYPTLPRQQWPGWPNSCVPQVPSLRDWEVPPSGRCGAPGAGHEKVDEWGRPGSPVHGPLGLEHFDLVQTVGTGFLGRVSVVKMRRPHGASPPLVLKVMEKSTVLAKKQVQHVLNERQILSSIRHPFCVSLVASFQASRPRKERTSTRRGRSGADADRRALAKQKELDLHAQLYGIHVQARMLEEASTGTGSAGSDTSDASSESDGWEAPEFGQAPPAGPAGRVAARFDDMDVDPFEDLAAEQFEDFESGPPEEPSEVAAAPPPRSRGGSGGQCPWLLEDAVWRDTAAGPREAAPAPQGQDETAALLVGGPHLVQLSSQCADWAAHVERAICRQHGQQYAGSVSRSKRAQLVEAAATQGTSAMTRKEPLRGAAARWWASVAALFGRIGKLRRRSKKAVEDRLLLRAAGRELSQHVPAQAKSLDLSPQWLARGLWPKVSELPPLAQEGEVRTGQEQPLTPAPTPPPSPPELNSGRPLPPQVQRGEIEPPTLGENWSSVGREVRRCPGSRRTPRFSALVASLEDAHAAFWLRGLLPASWTEVSAPPDGDSWIFLQGHRAGSVAPGEFGRGSELAPLILFGEASGGPEGQVPHLRRVGLAVARIQLLNGMLERAVWGSLSGPVQTVHRGELRALVLAAQGSLGPTVFVSDNLAVCVGWWSRRDQRPQGADSDLWALLGQLFLTRDRSEFATAPGAARAQHGGGLRLVARAGQPRQLLAMQVFSLPRRALAVDGVSLSRGLPHIGGGRPRASHILRLHERLGVWFCVCCGCFVAAAGRVVGLGLRARCLGRPSRAGRDCLQRLARGLWPKASGRRRFVRKEAELQLLHVPQAAEADGALDEVAHLALDDSIGDALGDSVLSSSPPRGLPVDATFPDKVAFLLSAVRGDAFSDVVVEGALDLKRRRLAAAASDDALSDVVVEDALRARASAAPRLPRASRAAEGGDR
ncbi:unnamed protein product, partial [Prorocentrum cordatum]